VGRGSSYEELDQRDFSRPVRLKLRVRLRNSGRG
jgi:hypothetical protein